MQCRNAKFSKICFSLRNYHLAAEQKHQYMYHTGSSNYNAYNGVRHINNVDSHHKYKILQQDQLTPKLQKLDTKKYLNNSTPFLVSFQSFQYPHADQQASLYSHHEKHRQQ